MEAASCPLQKCVGCLLPFPLLCVTLPPKHPLYSLLPHSMLSKSGHFPFILLALFFFPFFSHLCFSALPALTPCISFPLPFLPGRLLPSPPLLFWLPPHLAASTSLTFTPPLPFPAFLSSPPASHFSLSSPFCLPHAPFLSHRTL